MIHLFPIEPIKKRYSADWYRWWCDRLDNFDSLDVYDGERIQPLLEDGEEIQHGEFLDALDTNYYKATQLALFIKSVKTGKVKDGDIILLLDGWNPAVTSLGYIRAVVGIKFKIVIALHAGTWDAWDHLSLKGMGKWAGSIERGWFKVADSILVATDFHRKILNNHAGRILPNVKVTGFPLELDELNKYSTPWKERENLVVFPHRMAPEKQPEVFENMKTLFKESYPRLKSKWITTYSKDTYTTKEEMYRTLGRAKVSVSCALQETWGIVQLESWYLGAAPVVPSRLSYEELYPFKWKYKGMLEAIELIHQTLTTRKEIPEFTPKRHPKDSWGEIFEELRRIQCATT